VEYLTNFGLKGPMKRGDVPGARSVLRARDDDWPIGKADCLGLDGQGRPMFRLRIDGEPIEGLWLLVNREFVPAQESGRQSRG
jgi:hypothetical protein